MDVGIIGCFQNGKSTLINCLLGTKIAPTGGDGLSVTSANTIYCYSQQNTVLSVDGKKNNNFTLNDLTNGTIKNVNEIRIGCSSPILKHVTLIDTPGFNANTEDTQTALGAIEKIDFAIVVINNKGLSEVEINIFNELQLRNIPYFLIANCFMQQAESTWNPNSKFNQNLIKNIVAQLDNYNFTPMLLYGKKVTVLNSLWYWFAKTNFQFESEHKQKSLIRFINLYRSEFPQVDFLQESNFNPLLDFLSKSKNLMPIGIYLALKQNVIHAITNISTSLDKHAQQLQEIIYQNYNYAK